MIHLRSFQDHHTRNLPLVAARFVLDALGAAADISELTDRAAEKVAELCGRIGRMDLRAQFVEAAQTARAVREGTELLPDGQLVRLVVPSILVRVSAIIRACDPNHLPDDTVRAAGARKWGLLASAILKEPAGIPPRDPKTALSAYTKELRYLAGKLHDGQRYKRDDDAWVLTEFCRGSTQEMVEANERYFCLVDIPGQSLPGLASADDLWRPQGVFGAWRGHEVSVTRETLTAAGFDKLQEAFATAGLPREASGGKHSGAWGYVAAPERAVMPFFKPQQGSTRWFTASADRWCVPHQQYQDAFIPAVADFLERLANVIEARDLIP